MGGVCNKTPEVSRGTRWGDGEKDGGPGGEVFLCRRTAVEAVTLSLDLSVSLLFQKIYSSLGSRNPELWELRVQPGLVRSVQPRSGFESERRERRRRRSLKTNLCLLTGRIFGLWILANFHHLCAVCDLAELMSECASLLQRKS